MNEIEIIIIGDKINYHKKVKTPYTSFTIETDSYKMTIDPQGLQQVSKNILKRMYHRIFRGIKKHYQYFVLDSTKDKPGQMIAAGTWESGEQPASLVQIIDRTTVIGKAFAELFGRPISGRMLLYVGLIAIVGIVVYMLATGGLEIPGLGPPGR